MVIPCSGSLLVTASTEGHSFNVFHLIPHPWVCGESAVHHLYTLFRGATSASVQDIGISWDSRWVAVSTQNGTTHLFPITPYGGEINLRTHMSNRVVNKMSQFHTSAGIEAMGLQSHSHTATHPSSATSSSHNSNPPSHEDLPNSTPQPITWSNPRGTPLPSPVIVKALHQIKQPYLSNDGTYIISTNDPSRLDPIISLLESGGSSVGVSSSIGPSHSTSSGDSRLGGGDSQCVRAFFPPTHHNGDRTSGGKMSISDIALHD